MTTDELVDLGLGGGVHVLELVHSLELDDVETIGKDAVRFSLEEMLGFVGSNVGDSGKDVGTVGSTAFYAVAVVDTALASLVVDVKVLEVVVKVNGASAEVSSEKGSVCGEDSGDIDVSFAAERDGEAGLPLVEVCDDDLVELAGDVLEGGSE
jgi:hypothetical protein